MRLFLAVPLTQPIIDRLSVLQNRCRAVLQGSGAATARWVAPEKTHLTLQFLGDVEPHLQTALQTVMQEACTNTPPFALSSGSLGCFPNARRPRVLWAGVEGDTSSLGQLQQRIAAATVPLCANADNKPFSPHLTLARFGDRRQNSRPASDISE
ncbi:MAG TPA: RNA 2',3'-cyclic phosphodiesterase, partial [Abditibacteriaceae bacterium]